MAHWLGETLLLNPPIDQQDVMPQSVLMYADGRT
jgi:hypothetical protein